MNPHRPLVVPSARALPAALAALALVVTGCGSTLQGPELEAANGVVKQAVVGDGRGGGGADDSQALDAGSAPSGGESGVEAPGAGTAAVPGGAAHNRGAVASGESKAASPRDPRTAAGQASTGRASSGGSPAPQAPGGPRPGAAAGKKSEVLFGSFGVESGILGAVTGPAPPAVRAWAASVNARGGLNGHPVRVILAEDGGDPARAQAIVRQMVERDKILGFFYNYSVNTGMGVMPYLEQKQIPVIGSIGGDIPSDASSMFFMPLLSTSVGQAWALLLNVTAQTDKKKLGVLYCREASNCSEAASSMKKLLPYQGRTLVYEAQASLAQPDYTAEVLAAQRAGVEALIVILDSSAVIRVARSAHRQNYRPVMAGTYNLNQDLIFTGGEEVEGLLLNSRSAPWDSSPKLKGYRDMMARYQPGAARGDLGAGAYVVGRLLEEKVAPFISEPPTTAQILAGLYSLNKETLAGLLPGISFPRGKHEQVNWCVVPTRITKGKLVAHDAGESFVCAPNWKPAEPGT